MGRWLFRVLALAASTKATVCGIDVVNTGKQEESERLFDLLAQALKLLAETDRRLFERVRGNLKRIVIVAYDGSSYWPELAACALSRSTLEKQPREWVASVIVHEACHGRLHRCGFEYRGFQRLRIERVCIRAQARFLGRLPGTERLREHLAHQLQGHGLTDERLRRRAGQLETLGIPQWLAKRL